MFKKIDIICFFLTCFPLLGQPLSVVPVCNESDCTPSCNEEGHCHSICNGGNSENDLQNSVCNAVDVISFNNCITQAASEDLVIDLGGAKIKLSAQVNIANSGHSLLIRNGSLAGNNTFRILIISQGSKVSLEKLTIEDGYARDPNPNGGGILNLGELELFNAAIVHNKADNSGGGIFNDVTGDLTIKSSIISDNLAKDGSGNSGGGGIFNLGTISFISNSTIAGNTTGGFGAGINNQGTIGQICGSTISNNLNCTSVPGSGECELGQSPTGAGGGIFNEIGAIIRLLINSTIAKNISLQGGGIFNNGEFDSISNSTIARNTVNFGGGGIYNNAGANIGELTSNIIAQNVDNNELTLVAPDILNAGTIASENYNFIGDNRGVPTIMDGVNNDIVNDDPHLLDLQNNGGNTYTMALDPRSRAINNGLNPNNLLWDQRNDPFVRVYDGRPDIGAYEFQPFDFCRKPCPCPCPCPNPEHHHHESIGPIVNSGIMPFVPPYPVPVPVPPAPIPNPIPVAVPVEPANILPARVPVSAPIDVVVSKTDPADKFNKTLPTLAEKSGGCSTTRSGSQSANFMFLLFLMANVLRNLLSRKIRKEKRYNCSPIRVD